MTLLTLLSLATAAPSGWSPPPVQTGDLQVPAQTLTALTELKNAVEAELAAGEVEAVAARFMGQEAAVATWFKAAAPHAQRPMELRLDPLWPTDHGAVCGVEIFSPSDDRGGVSRYHNDAMTVSPDGRGGWYFDGSVAGQADVQTTRVQLRVDPAGEWIEVAAELDLLTLGHRIVALSLGTRDPGVPGGLRMIEVLADDVPAPFYAAAGRLVIALPERERVTLALRYAGEPHTGDSGYVRADDLLLRGRDTPWLPLFDDDLQDFEVEVVTPSDFVVFGQGKRVASWASEGQRGVSWALDNADAYTVYGAPDYALADTRVGGTALKLALWPRHRERLEPTRQRAVEALSSLTGRLGPYPYPTLRIVESGFKNGRGGYGAVSNIAIGWRAFDSPLDPAYLAHEMAHGWFGGQLHLAASAQRHGQWNESFAEYVSASVVDERAALALRERWSRRYASLPADKDRAMIEVGTAGASWQLHNAVTYSKGALVMTALEDRLGQQAMDAWLRSLLSALQGQQVTWDQIVASLPAADGAWLQGWLSRSGAPRLRLEASWQRRSAQVRLLQAGDQAGTVEVGFVDQAGSSLGQRRLAFSGPSTEHTLTLPKGTSELVLDPRYRLPRRYDPAADPVSQGLRVRR